MTCLRPLIPFLGSAGRSGFSGFVLISAMPESHYHYTDLLDRRSKIAASPCLVILLGGTALILSGIERMSMDLATRQFKIPLIFASCLVVVFLGLFYGVGKIRWITEIHSWMDRRFFRDRKSTRLNSSHLVISYAVFCLKKKKIDEQFCTVSQEARFHI